MFILSCRVCNENFEAKTRRRVYCTQRCKDQGKPSASNLSCFICEKSMIKGRTSKPQGEAAHNACRTDVGKARSHGNSGYRSGCRCDVCRDGHRNRMRDYEERVKARDGASPSAQFARSRRGVDPLLELPDCSICKERLKRAPQNHERPMHKDCRSSAPTWKRRGLENPKITEFRRRIEIAEIGTSGGKRVFVNGPCEWCGDSFMAAAGRYCSNSCRASDKFRRRGSGRTFNPSKRERKAVYDRDRWTCQICANPVPVGVLLGSPWYPTLDHVIPQSKMIVPDHSPSNLRLVHSWCNSARGDGSNMAEMELVARARQLFSERVTFAA